MGMLDLCFGEHNYITITRYSRAQQPFVDIDYMHCTHCAGLIAADNNRVMQMRGVADNAYLVYFGLEHERGQDHLRSYLEEAIAK